MTQPGIRKRKDGTWEVTGSNDRVLNQTQADYEDLVKASQLITGEQGIQVRNLIKNNPSASAGLIAGLAQYGAVPDNDLTKTLVEIDRMTRQEREKNMFLEGQRIANEKFKDSYRGRFWNVLKASIRGLSILPETGLELLGSGARSFRARLDAKMAGELTWFTEQPTDPNKTINQVLNRPEDESGLKYIVSQTKAFQIAKDLIDGNKIDLGEGFFPSEETGQGFKARQAQLDAYKVAIKLDNGQVYYRPYSVIDPVTEVLPFVEPEDTVGTVVSALGDLLVMLRTDPGIAYARIRRAAQEAERATRISSGLQTSKAMQRKALLDIELDEAAKKTQEALEELNKATGFKKFVKQEEYDKAFDSLTKMADEYDNMVYDVNLVAGFLGSKAAEPLIDAIASIDNWQDIYALGKKGKKRAGLTVEQSKVLAAAKTRDEVLAAIAPFIAGGNVVADVLETGTKVGKAISGTATRIANSRIVPGTAVQMARSIKGLAAKGYRKTPVLPKIMNTLSKNYNTILPGGTFVHAADVDGLVDMVYSYGRAAKLDEKTIADIADSVAFAEDASKAGYDASGKLFNSIFARHAEKIGVDKAELEKVTRLFEGGREKMSMYWAERHADGAKLDYLIGPGGKKYTISGPHLDSEFLNSMIYFPPAEELLRTISTFNKLKYKGVGLVDAADFLTSTLWKRMVLVRPAYIIRNIAEEQIRVVGTGHVSFFNNPVTAVAMWLGRDNGPAWRRLLNSFDPYRNTIMGTNLKLGSAADEFAAEVLAHDARESYAAFMAANTITSVDRDARTAVKFAGFGRVDYGHERWWEGLASEVRILSNSLAGRVVARTAPGFEKGGVDFVLRGGGKDEWTKFAERQPKEIRDWLLTDEGAMTYLFTGKSVTPSGREVLTSVRARVDEATGRGGEASQALKNLIAYGNIEQPGLKIAVPKGVNGADNSIKNAKEVSAGKKQLKDINQEFADQLKQAFNGKGDWEGLSMIVPISKFGRKQKDERGIINGIVDGFFSAAIRFEKTSTMGPEWRQKYWDAIYDISSALDENAVAKLSATARESLTPLKSWKGEPVGQQHKVWKAFERTKPGGNISVEEAHEYASMVASRHVAELFYDASKKRLLFHQLRLIAPFGQAWEDTIKAWGNIALNNPAQIYKGIRPLSWLNNPESSALYQLTDARDYYDPNQGFFFRDPLDGQRKFFIPFAATGLNFIPNLISGKNPFAGGPFAIGATPQSFNFAFASGSIIPGVGPGLSIGIQILDRYFGNPLNLLPKDMRLAAYNLVFPFGEPDLKAGFIEAQLPGNWRRILAPLLPEEAYSSAFAPVMNYLASGGNYDLMDPEDQTRLIGDTNKFSQWFTFMRGLFGTVSPFPFLTQGVTTLDDGNTLLTTELYNKFKEIEVKTADRNKAYAEFFDTFGPEAVLAIVATSTGAPTNLYTYELIQRDPSVVDDYPSTYGYIYPNGGYSAELYRWQRKMGNKEKFDSEELKNRAVSLLYYAAKDRLMTRATAENWPSEQYDEANANLKQAFIGARLTQEGDFYKEAKIKDELIKLANDKRFDDSDAVAGLKDYLYLRQAALNNAGITSDNLARKDAVASRAWLANEAKKIIQRHPDFQKLFYAFFKKELEG